MHIATRKEIIDLNEGAVCIDHRMIGVNYRHALDTAEALNVSPDSFRIIASNVTAPPVLITLRTKTCNYLQQSNTEFDKVGQETIPN